MNDETKEKAAKIVRRLIDIRRGNDRKMPTRNELAESVVMLEQELTEVGTMLTAVTEVINGSTKMEHLEQYREADALVQNIKYETMKASLERAKRFLDKMMDLSLEEIINEHRYVTEEVDARLKECM